MSTTRSVEEFIDDRYECVVSVGGLRPDMEVEKTVSSVPPVCKSKHKQKNTALKQPKGPAKEKQDGKKRKRNTASSSKDKQGKQIPDSDIDWDSDDAFEPDLPELPLDEEKKAEILGKLSSWLGEMNWEMQQTFNKRFDDAVENMRSELIGTMRQEMMGWAEAVDDTRL